MTKYLQRFIKLCLVTEYIFFLSMDYDCQQLPSEAEGIARTLDYNLVVMDPWETSIQSELSQRIVTMHKSDNT